MRFIAYLSFDGMNVSLGLDEHVHDLNIATGARHVQNGEALQKKARVIHAKKGQKKFEASDK